LLSVGGRFAVDPDAQARAVSAPSQIDSAAAVFETGNLGCELVVFGAECGYFSV
jgi:hypothetical protein